MNPSDIISTNKSIRNAIAVISRYLFYSRKQQFYYSNAKVTELLDIISLLLPELTENINEINGDIPVIEPARLINIVKEMYSAMEYRDYIMLSDIIEMQLYPVFIAIQERLITYSGIVIDEQLLKENVQSCNADNPLLLHSLMPSELIDEILSKENISDSAMSTLIQLINTCSDNGIDVDSTHCGYPTLTIQQSGNIYYLHTDGNVIAESIALASEWLSQDKENYTFYGLGLGYQYLEMLSMDHNINIRVYESNHDLLLLAMVFGQLGSLYSTERFQLIYDPTGRHINDTTLSIDDNNGTYIYYPAITGINNQQLKKQLETYFVNESSVRTQSRALIGNYRRNSRVESKGIDALFSEFKDKNVIIVAAGPSLDNNMHLLKEKKKDTIILAAGTVLKKLLNADITPDYVIITDANMSAYPQIKGIEDCKVPLIFLSTVYSRIPSSYCGDKYILCQKGFRPSEELATHNNWMLVESGGSVMTTALDLCLKLHVNKIIFTGLDLAYTNSKDHASDTAQVRSNVPDTGIYVDAVGGGKVQTTKNLNIYLEWIENRLYNRSEEEKKIPVIDATEGGAIKKGMQIMTLENAI